MIVKFLRIGDKGGGNLVINSLSEFGKEDCRVTVSEVISLNLRASDKFWLSDKLITVIAIPYHLIRMRLRDKRKPVKYVFSDPLVASFAFLVPEETRVRYVQSDDINLHSSEDGFSYVFVILFRALVRFSYAFNWRHIIFNSRFTRDAAHLDGPYPVVYPVIDSEVFRGIEKTSNTSKEEVVVCGIWRKQKRKNSDDYIALTQFYSGDQRVRFKLLVDGGQPNLPVFNSESCACTFVNSRDALLTEISCADVLIQTSTFEGFGLPTWEALRLGKLVIARGCEGTNSLPFSGSLILVDSVLGMKMSLDKVLESDHDSIRDEKATQERLAAALAIDPKEEHQKFFDIILGGQ